MLELPPFAVTHPPCRGRVELQMPWRWLQQTLPTLEILHKIHHPIYFQQANFYKQFTVYSFETVSNAKTLPRAVLISVLLTNPSAGGLLELAASTLSRPVSTPLTVL